MAKTPNKNTMLGKAAQPKMSRKQLTGAVIDSIYNARQKGLSTVRVGGETYSVAGISRQLRDIMSPSGYQAFLAGKIKDIKPSVTGRSKLRITASKGAAVNKKKMVKQKPKTKSKTKG